MKRFNCRSNLLASVAFAGALALAATPALSANLDAGLELDGNIINNPVGAPLDWSSLFNPGGLTAPFTPEPSAVSPLPAGFGSAQFIRDFVPGASGPDFSTFATGSKDTLNPTPGWECNKDNNVIDKNDVVNAYAAIFTAPPDPGETVGDVILYMGLERFSNEGEANLGFWFSQDAIGCTIVSGNTGSFTGNRSDGDLNIFAQFESGGDNVLVVARAWSGGAAGFLDPNPIATGGDCGDSVAGTLCGNANDEGAILNANIPWHTETKKPGNQPSLDLNPGEFFEAAINLTDSGLLACFSNYMAVSRSSNSLTADLKDYALDAFPLCALSGTKLCSADPNPGFCLLDPADSCTLNSQCTNGAGDRCVTTNPFIDSDGLTVVMDNDVAITNDGLSTVYDVGIKETNTTFETGEFCAITAVNGTPVTAIDLTDNLFHAVPNGAGYTGSLAGGATLTVTVTCETDDNPFPNSVDARSATVDDSGTFNVNASGINLDTGSDPCTASANPAIGLSKQCVDVRLVSTGSSGDLLVEVLTKITVTNTGDEALNNVSVTDTVGGTLASGQTLAPGASKTYNVVDRPAIPGETQTSYCAIGGTACTTNSQCSTLITGDTCNTTTLYDPDDASFSNTANASGTGAFSGGTANATPASAQCFLCPQP